MAANFRHQQNTQTAMQQMLTHSPQHRNRSIEKQTMLTQSTPQHYKPPKHQSCTKIIPNFTTLPLPN